MTTLTQQGIEAMRRGDKVTAHQLLQQAVQQNPQDINAWLWLSGAVSADQERLHCLQQVIRIDPENAAAAKGIAQLISRGAVTVEMAQGAREAPGIEPAVMAKNRPAAASVVKGQESQPTPAQPAQPRPAAAKPRRGREEIIFKVSPSPIPVLVRGGFLLVLLILAGMLFRDAPVMLVFLVIPLVIFTVAVVIVRLVQRSFAVYTLTRSQLVVQKGVLNKQKKTIPVQKIQDVSYRQPILDRIFGLGDVVVESAGERGEVRLVSLHNCVAKSEEILKVVQLE